jgi:hypothetical protein
MSRILVILFGLLISGCSTVTKYVEKVENLGYSVSDKMTQKDGCVSETTQVKPDATTQQYYRCVGGGCQSYGCKGN